MRTCLGTAGEGADPPLVLERFMPYRLPVSGDHVSRAGFGRRQRLSAGEVAARVGMDEVKANRAVAAMERKGLLDRTADPENQRATRPSLTPTGLAICETVARWAPVGAARLTAEALERS